MSASVDPSKSQAIHFPGRANEVQCEGHEELQGNAGTLPGASTSRPASDSNVVDTLLGCVYNHS